MADARFSELPLATFNDAFEWGGNDGGVSRKANGALVRATVGLEYLGSTKLTSAAHETSVVNIAARDFLMIFIRIASYGGSPDPTGDIGSLRFNGDTGANYWSQHAQFIAGAWTEFSVASATLIRLAGTNSRLSRNVLVTVNNLATRGKTCNIKNQTGTADATVVGTINIGGGEWVNLVDQITSVQLVDQGSNNMGASTGFLVMGKNF